MRSLPDIVMLVLKLLLFVLPNLLITSLSHADWRSLKSYVLEEP